VFHPHVSALDIPLSVLDLAPVGEGSTPTDALRGALQLAAEAERLGYRRYWVAEHHNMPGIASSSPAVLLAHAAGVTSTIRLGSGGVMLPNHASLVVAEQFGMLEALHPGRIDLGIGRAPGTDPLTARALRRGPQGLAADDFPDQLVELLGYFTGAFPEGHPYARITAVPGLGHRPELWLLGSSDYSAHAAGVLGLPFSFAHHFAAANTLPAVQVYRAAFRPSDDLAEPYLMLGVSVVCAETDEQARWLAGPGRLAFLRLRSGRPGRYPTPEEAAAHTFTPHEREVVKAWTSSHIVGDPPTVLARLAELAERTGADELIVTTLTHATTDRLASYRLVAGVAGLDRADRDDAVALTDATT
jgi:luciferase family oxidoreductase group 1